MTVDLETVPGTLPDSVSGIDGVRDVTVRDSTLDISCADPAKGPVVHQCVEATTVQDVETSQASLEDIFAAYTEGGA
jgi:ABC-2 type transport system ATP-binding protein